MPHRPGPDGGVCFCSTMLPIGAFSFLWVRLWGAPANFLKSAKCQFVTTRIRQSIIPHDENVSRPVLQRRVANTPDAMAGGV
jgi:hypothetical protein